MANRIQDLLGVEIPVIQAPMTYIARAGLASAVSNAGGLGVIETITPEGRADLARMRDLTDRPFAANLLIGGWKHDHSIVDTIAATGAPIVTTSAGDPALFADRLHEHGITVLHVVGNLRAAQKAVVAGVDGLIVEGVEGGGFKGALGASTLVLLPLIAAHTDLPLVAAGGICDGPSAAAAIVLGAEGVQMGTRMLATHEAGVHDNFKKAITGATDDATVLISVPGNPTMRVLRNELSSRAAAGDVDQRLLHRITDLYFDGDMEASVANTGQVSARIGDVLPAADVVRDTWAGVEAGLNGGLDRVS